jgi:hypothetical protein
VLRSMRPVDITDVTEFCRLLARTHKETGTCRTPLERFCIGLYQIHGAISWNDPAASSARDESLAASFIHFVTTMEMLNLHVENYINRDLVVESRNSLDYRFLMEHLSKSMQMLWYNNQAGKTQRASRYKPETLSHSLGIACKMLLQTIAPECRADAIETATDIMTRKL